MFSRVRRRITYTNVAMTLALVFAMSSGAYAAGKYLITSTKQIKPSVLAQLKGKSGKNGAAGATGPAGPAGPAGATGAKGETGTAGPEGKEGKAGVSVTSKELTSKDTACKKEGGSEFTSSSGSTVACNGSPWAAGGTLPVGSSETGEWSIVHTTHGVEITGSAISFVIPLAKALDLAHVHFIKQEEGAGEAKENLPVGCSGNWLKPVAASGNLCVFAKAMVDAETGGFAGEPVVGLEENVGADRWGAQLRVLSPAEGLVGALGTWVVTG